MRLLACLSLALFAPFAPAADASLEALLAQSRDRALASHPHWLALGHYRARLGGGVMSEIVSADFFLAENGPTDPAAELEATLAALLDQPGPDPDAHAQCRFVARYRWLRRMLDWGGQPPRAVACPKFHAYSLAGRVEGISLVYATGYFSNPASYYGHILIKFNGPRALVESDLLDQSLNFGAAVPANEDPFRYVLKGLFGGYDGAFSHQQFYHFNHAYAENELRDMWEYVLALEPHEIDEIVSHSWELLGKTYVYYFLKENCAYRMAELLEAVLGEPLLPDLPWSLPGAVPDRLAAMQRKGKPLVSEVRRIPSRQNSFRARYLHLGEEGRRAARALVDQSLDFTTGSYAALASEDKVPVVDTLIDYYEYRVVRDRKSAELPEAKRKLLAERVSLPPRGADAPAPAGDEPAPHEGPRPFLLRSGVLHNEQRGDGLEIRLRPANYDTLSLDVARIPSSTLAMFDLRLVHLDGTLRLRSLDLVHVENLNPAMTALPLDGGLAWSVRVGLDSLDLACSECTVFRAGGGLGKAFFAIPRVLAFAMLDAAAQTEHAGSGSLAIGPRVGAIASLATGWKSVLSVARVSYPDGTRPGHDVIRWENRFGTRRGWDLRLSYEDRVASEIGFGLSLYW